MGQLPLVQQRFQGGAQAVGLLLQVLANGDLKHPVFPPVSHKFHILII